MKKVTDMRVEKRKSFFSFLVYFSALYVITKAEMYFFFNFYFNELENDSRGSY